VSVFHSRKWRPICFAVMKDTGQRQRYIRLGWVSPTHRNENQYIFLLLLGRTIISGQCGILPNFSIRLGDQLYPILKSAILRQLPLQFCLKIGQPGRKNCFPSLGAKETCIKLLPAITAPSKSWKQCSEIHRRSPRQFHLSKQSSWRKITWLVFLNRALPLLDPAKSVRRSRMQQKSPILPLLLVPNARPCVGD